MNYKHTVISKCISLSQANKTFNDIKFLKYLITLQPVSTKSFPPSPVFRDAARQAAPKSAAAAEANSCYRWGRCCCHLPVINVA